MINLLRANRGLFPSSQPFLFGNIMIKCPTGALVRTFIHIILRRSNTTPLSHTRLVYYTTIYLSTTFWSYCARFHYIFYVFAMPSLPNPKFLSSPLARHSSKAVLILRNPPFSFFSISRQIRSASFARALSSKAMLPP